LAQEFVIFFTGFVDRNNVLYLQIAEPLSDIKAPADRKPKQFVYFYGTEN